MVNILIADDNIYYAKTLMDIINNSMKGIRVVNITIDGQETRDRLNKANDIDIVLLDLKMPIISGIEIIKNLPEDKKDYYKNSIIVISGETEMIEKIRDESVVYSYIHKMSSMTDILEKVNELVRYKEKQKNRYQVKEAIKEELQELNYNFSHKGTVYLVDAIYLIYTKEIEDELNLKKNVYPILSKKYNRPIYSIKSDIVKATNFMDIACNKNKKNEYFSFYDNTKPTVKVVIYTILNNIHKKIN